GLLDKDVLPLRELPALDELVRLDVALVHRAPALLLDRRPAVPVQGAERHVLPLGRKRKPDGDVDEAEADRSVPDGPHEKVQFSWGPAEFSILIGFPAYDSAHGKAHRARALARRRPRCAHGTRLPRGAGGRMAARL